MLLLLLSINHSKDEWPNKKEVSPNRKTQTSIKYGPDIHPHWPIMPSSNRKNDSQGSCTSNFEYSTSNLMLSHSNEVQLEKDDAIVERNDLDQKGEMVLAPLRAQSEHYAPCGKGDNGVRSNPSCLNFDSGSFIFGENSNTDRKQFLEGIESKKSDLISTTSFDQTSCEAIGERTHLDPKIQTFCKDQNTEKLEFLPELALSSTIDSTCGLPNTIPVSDNVTSDWSRHVTLSDSSEGTLLFQSPRNLSLFAPGNDSNLDAESVNEIENANFIQSYLGAHPVNAPIPGNELSGYFEINETIPYSGQISATSANSIHLNQSVTGSLPCQNGDMSEQRFFSHHSSDTLSYDSSQQLHKTSDNSLFRNTINENVQKDLINLSPNSFPFSQIPSDFMTDTNVPTWHPLERPDSQTITPKRVSRMCHSLSTNMTPSLVSKKIIYALGVGDRMLRIVQICKMLSALFFAP